jgi:hypothetical protein
MATRYARAGRWVLPSFYFCQVSLPNCWRAIFLVLPKLDGCQVDLPNCWSCSKFNFPYSRNNFEYIYIYGTKLISLDRYSLGQKWFVLPAKTHLCWRAQHPPSVLCQHKWLSLLAGARPPPLNQSGFSKSARHPPTVLCQHKWLSLLVGARLPPLNHSGFSKSARNK